MLFLQSLLNKKSGFRERVAGIRLNLISGEEIDVFNIPYKGIVCQAENQRKIKIGEIFPYFPLISLIDFVIKYCVFVITHI